MQTDVALDDRIKNCILKPRPGRLIAEADSFVYKGILAIPDTAKRRPTSGVVLKIGESVDEDLLGKRIVWPMYSGTLIEFKNQPAYHILSQDEILVTVESNDAELENAHTVA